SLSLNGANVPLDVPLASNLAGTLAIQSAEVGPGAVGQQVLGLARQARSFLGQSAEQPDSANANLTLLSFPQQDVPFEVRDAVAHHHGLKMMVGDLAIVTQGSVNIQTEEFDLVANVTLPESLFRGREGLLASLKGQPLQIPIKGSFNRPPNLQNALAGWLQQNAGSAVRNVIGNQIEKRLQGEGGLLQQGEGLLQRGGGGLQRELGQGLKSIFGQPPVQPQPAPPTPRPR
ncbi:MAG TPA: hypothetical protein VKH44_14050, partial [Pirellulaceae bacterium]|nr:hypothetical protein [Pirellulaceae bacterium]